MVCVRVHQFRRICHLVHRSTIKSKLDRGTIGSFSFDIYKDLNPGEKAKLIQSPGFLGVPWIVAIHRSDANG